MTDAGHPRISDSSRMAAVLLSLASLLSCSEAGPAPGQVRIHRGHTPGYTKDTKSISVAVANYVPVDANSDLYTVERGTRLSFKTPAYFLVSKWNLLGGDQESILMELNSRTLRPWQECLTGPIEKPISLCPAERPLLVRVWSNLRPAVPLTIRPDLKAFPASDLTSFHGRHVSPVGEVRGFEVVGYSDVWSGAPESRTAMFGTVDLYSSSLFLYPRDFQTDQVKLIDCVRTETFCKAYLPFHGKWVEFQVYKDQMSDVRETASGIAQTLSKMLTR